MKLVAPVLVALALIGQAAQSSTAESVTPAPLDTQEYLLQFHKNPKQVMNSPLLKRDASGKVLPAPRASEASRQSLFEAKSEIREKICSTPGTQCSPKAKPGLDQYAAFGESNQITGFLYNPTYLKKLLEMENHKLQQVILPEQPWSDSFWPAQKGEIARRWADSSFPDSNDWITNFDYVSSLPAWMVSPEILSPSEKYDLLVGDNGLHLTDKMWGVGREKVAEGRKVPSWVGLCHGWSRAAIMAANPKKTITVYSPNGIAIPFYPSDIKALASLAWGEATPPKYKQVGSRCKVRNPQEDAVGRVLDVDCFDVNPGTWHMAIVNQVGVEKRSFTFDSTYDEQVWNYPIYAYQYQYFNPQTLATSNRMAGALVKINEFSIDKFKTYRSPEARYVVGVAMDVTYSVPTQPRKSPVQKASTHTVKYVYDLELDGDGNILGGEWYSNWHPDFIGNPPPDGKPISNPEKNLGEPLVWSGSGPVSPQVQQMAIEASAQGQPLGAVVETLIRLAQ